MASVSAVQIEGISLNIQVKDNASEKLNKIASSLERLQGAMDVQGIKNLGSASTKSANGLSKLAKSTSQFVNSVMRIAKYRLIRTALKAITQGLTEGIQNLARYSAAIGETDSAAANSVMSDYASKFLEVKNAVGAAAMPVLAALQPIIIWVANAFITAANAINMFVAALRGSTTFTRATAQTVDYAKSLDKATGSAKKFKDATAGIDELNVINQDTSSGGGGGGITPDYANMFTEDVIPQGLLDKLALIKDLALAISAALLAWKIASMFTDDLGKIAGLALAAAGAVLFLSGIIDAWNNGFNLDNLIQTLTGAAILIAGLALAFGRVGAGVGALVVGILLLVTAFRDMDINGVNLYNTLAAIAGIIATGLGLSLLTLSVIPLFIAAILGAVVALVYFTGQGQLAFQGLKDIVGGFVEWFQAIIAGDGQAACDAINRMFYGVLEVGTAVINAFQILFNSALDFIDNLTHGKLKGITDFVRSLVNGLAESVKQILGGVTEFLAGVFTGDWERAWNGILDVFSGIANRIVVIFESVINLIISGINWLIEKVNSLLDAPILDEVGLGGAKIPTIAPVSLGRIGTGESSSTSSGHGGGGGISRFADGGYPTMGQLFYASERGAEMVGSIDGRTAVANNQDIVNAVASGVYSAVTSAMSNNNNNGVQSINVFLDGKQIEASVRNTKQRRGASIANGGIYNFA